MEIDASLLNDFIEESRDILKNLNEIIENILGLEDHTNSINVLFRGVHTIKGGSSMFNLTNIHHIAHELETYMSKLKDKKESLTQDNIQRITKDLLSIEKLLENPNSTESSFSSAFTKFLDDFKEIIEDLKHKNCDIFEIHLPKESEHSIKILSSLESKKIEKMQEAPINSQNMAYLLYVPHQEIDQENHADIYNILKALEEKDCLHWIYQTNIPNIPVQKEKATSTTTPKIEVLRVPMDKINSSLDNIWEIFLVRNQISFLFDQNNDWIKSNPFFAQSFESLDNILRRNIAELESKVMSMRMGSLEGIFKRMEKIVEDYSKETNKKIKFITSGEKTELDKKVIDMLAEPLTHLIRNAMDHGIEANQEKRIQLKKNSEGKIELKASIYATTVLIQVIDDGKGINPEELLESAKRKNIDTSNLKTKEQIINLIFAPGFSTAASISSVSGRGVGMDAVANSIRELGGSINIETIVDKGTTFSIDIPLGVAVTSAIIVKINNFLYAISARDLVNVKKISQYVLHKNANKILYKFNDTYLECVKVSDYFIHNKDIKDDEVKTKISACVIKHNNELFCLLVDSIKYSTDLVIRPMPEYSPKCHFISGVSILESGQCVFMLSVKGLYQQLRN